jgi:hypothetical protein
MVLQIWQTILEVFCGFFFTYPIQTIINGILGVFSQPLIDGIRWLCGSIVGAPGT